MSWLAFKQESRFAIGKISATEERKEVFDFTPYYEKQISLLIIENRSWKYKDLDLSK